MKQLNPKWEQINWQSAHLVKEQETENTIKNIKFSAKQNNCLASIGYSTGHKKESYKTSN